MNRTIDVILGSSDEPIALLHCTRDGAREHVAFEYHAAWLQRADRFRIDPLLPLVSGSQFVPRVANGTVFPSAIADTEPDGWGTKVILRDHAKRRAAARAAGMDLPPILGRLEALLAVDDESRLGALRFRDESGVYQRASEPGRRTAPPLIELADLLASTRAVEENRETAEDLEYLRGRATSLGGMRPKCTVRDADGSLAIGKFPSLHDERACTMGEVLALQLAARAGINAAKARIELSEDSPVAIITRFDREGSARLMYVSAATLMGARPDDSVEHTYTEIVDTIRRFGAHVSADIEELWRRIAFSVLINNVDDHLLNHGFLHVSRETWQLSPAFDVNPFPERARELKTWISEDTGPAASIDALFSITRYCGMTHERAVSVLSEVEVAVSQWRQLAAAIGLTPFEIEQFADAFEHEERATAQRLIRR